MAREIVITSVPRGVKLGRTGFQVAMQTAGLRDDLASQLEKMAGYRHLPTGVPNPVCFFHRITKTFAGQANVLGRIVDAGVDFSNRSNKLAHMVVLEAADVGQVAAASPAAVLAAIEGRLASTWPGPPEERREPFGLAGIPASQAARCTLWQQVLGDAGWAGVLAERAVRGQPTLVIGPDSSPATCRRMLALFQEALAVVPAAKRWGVTFDTTSLSPEGVLWRGTYAGSPESQAAQPGVLVVDLSRPQPIPSNLAAGDLVTIAREGPPVPVMPRPGTGGSGSQAPPVPGGPQPSPSAAEFGSAASGGRSTQSAGSGPGGAPPPPPMGSHDVFAAGRSGRTERKSYTGLIVGLVLGFALLTVVGGGGIYVFLRAQARHRDAIDTFRAYADDDGTKGAPAPNKDDLALALGYRSGSDEVKAAEESLAFVNDWLKSEEGGGRDVENKVALKKVFDAVGAVRIQTSDKHRESLKTLFPGREPRLYHRVADSHDYGYREWSELRGQMALVTIEQYALDETSSSRSPSAIDYRHALGIEGAEATERKSFRTFMNALMRDTENNVFAVDERVGGQRRVVSIGSHKCGAAGLTRDDLKALVNAVHAVMSPRGEGQRIEGMKVLARTGHDGLALLDEIHPQPFEDYGVFHQLVVDVGRLAKLAQSKPAQRDANDVTGALWDVIVAYANPEATDESSRKQFAKNVVPADLASGKALAAKLGASDPVKHTGGGKQESEAVSGGSLDALAQLHANIVAFNKQRRDVAAQLDDGRVVELFDTAGLPVGGNGGLEVRVGASTGRVEVDPFEGATVKVKGDEVLVIEFADQKLKVRPGSRWAENSKLVKFMPIAVVYQGKVLQDNWFVLAPPDTESIPAGNKTLFDLLCTGTKSVSLEGLPKELDPKSLKLSERVISVPDNPVSLEVQADGNHANLRFSAVVKTATDPAPGGVLSDETYAFEVPIQLERTALSRDVHSPSFMEKKSLLGFIRTDPATELGVIGFKDSPLGKVPALRGVASMNNWVDVVQALLSDWRKTERPKNEADSCVKAWKVVDKKDACSLYDFRELLRACVLNNDASSGFAAEMRKQYELTASAPESPGDYSPPERKQGMSDAEFDEVKRKEKQKHEKRKGEYDTYKDNQKKFLSDQIRSPRAIRQYLHSQTVQQRLYGNVAIDSDLAAVIALLELDGLIVAKVYRQDLVSLLERIPLEALVEGDAKPEQWTVNGLGNAANGIVDVPEVRFGPAKVRPASTSSQTNPDEPEPGAGGTDGTSTGSGDTGKGGNVPSTASGTVAP